MNKLLKPVMFALLLANVSLAVSEPTKLTVNDELIFAVTGTGRSLAFLAGMMIPFPGLLFAAAVDPAEGDSDLIEISNILARGANIDFKDHWGYTALIYAAYHGYPKIAQYLVYRGANKNISEDKGYTALAMAQYYVDKYKRMLSSNDKADMVRHYEKKILRYEQTVQVLQ